jgi:hypothetical protein
MLRISGIYYGEGLCIGNEDDMSAHAEADCNDETDDMAGHHELSSSAANYFSYSHEPEA